MYGVQSAPYLLRGCLAHPGQAGSLGIWLFLRSTRAARLQPQPFRGGGGWRRRKTVNASILDAAIAVRSESQGLQESSQPLVVAAEAMVNVLISVRLGVVQYLS